jgi:Raf kinase inhibitor-like YbhB/YbcL family protein
MVRLSGGISVSANNAPLRLNRDLSLSAHVKVSSHSFKEGSLIPSKYTCDGQDVSPHLSWEQGKATAYAVIMEDPDAPIGTFYHWAIYNVTSTELPEGVSKNINTSFGMQGINDFGKPGYGGPCPPRGPPHRYYFRVYGLSGKLNLAPGAPIRQVLTALKGNIVDEGTLMGRYGRGGK